MGTKTKVVYATADSVDIYERVRSLQSSALHHCTGLEDIERIEMIVEAHKAWTSYNAALTRAYRTLDRLSKPVIK